MTDRDEYQVHREQYAPDHTASVKCCCCDQYCPKDEAAEYKGEWFDRYCAEKEGLRMCAWCGEWDEAVNIIAWDGDDYHPACVDQMAHEDDVTKKEIK